MAKRNFLIWGAEDAGKSTFAASLMAQIPQPDGAKVPARWPRVFWLNLDKPGVGSVAGYFREGTGARLVEPKDWDGIASALAEAKRLAARGEIDALVVEGLSVYYSDDVGDAALENPDAVTAGGNAMRGLYKAPKMRLQAILSGIRGASKRAKSDDFVVVLTAHAKEVGEDRTLFPDVSRNAWRQFVRLCEVVLFLKRPVGKAPKITYKLEIDDLLCARVNNDDALRFFDKIHAKHNEQALERMRTIPGLVALLDGAERQKQKRAADAAAPATTTSET